MLRENQITEAGKLAAAQFGHGFHCAEAVAWSVMEALGQDPSEAAAHATAFGGGMGQTYAEACGALSGGLIVIGHLYGRRRPGAEWDQPAKLGAALQGRFRSLFGTTHCASLRKRFGPDQQMPECRKIVHQVVTSLLSLLGEQHDKN